MRLGWKYIVMTKLSTHQSPTQSHFIDSLTELKPVLLTEELDFLIELEPLLNQLVREPSNRVVQIVLDFAELHDF